MCWFFFSAVYKKPTRPCPFCGLKQAKLTRHLKRRHINEEAVSQAMKLPPKERDRVFDDLKKKGILQLNTKNKTVVMRERAQGSHEIVMCAGCKGFYSRRRISDHKKKCTADSSLSTGFVRLSPVAPSSSEEIRTNILDKFRSDEVGNICRSDKAIVLLGTKLWAKSTRKERKVIMSDMRILGNLVSRTRKKTKDLTFSGEDLVKRCNFSAVSEVITEMSIADDGQLKAGLKVSIGFILRKLIKILRGEYVMCNEMEKAEELDLFSTVLSYNWDYLFFSAQVACESKRTNLRKPEDMPLEEDVKRLREFIVAEMIRISEDNLTMFDAHLFVRLRNLIVSRLTLFNARRGGEPARMTLEDWFNAESDVWIDPQLVENISDPLEKELIQKFKLAYQSGKGSKRLVPVLIPVDTIKPLKKLVQERTLAGISNNNAFLFPNTGASLDHVSGYVAVKNVTKMVDSLEKPHLLIADKYRHRASTLFALLDVPEHQRHVFYRHMGHSESINQNVYQCPLAIQEITRVGSFFHDIDNQTTATDINDNNNVQSIETIPQSSQQLVEEEFTPKLPQYECKEQKSKLNNSRRYMAWSDEDAKNVKSYFKDFVENIDSKGAKGSLPSKQEILCFLQHHEIFENKALSEKTLVNLVKTKVFNERNKYRKESLFQSI